MAPKKVQDTSSKIPLPPPGAEWGSVFSFVIEVWQISLQGSSGAWPEIHPIIGRLVEKLMALVNGINRHLNLCHLFFTKPKKDSYASNGSQPNRQAPGSCARLEVSAPAFLSNGHDKQNRNVGDHDKDVLWEGAVYVWGSVPFFKIDQKFGEALNKTLPILWLKRNTTIRLYFENHPKKNKRRTRTLKLWLEFLAFGSA